MPGKRTAKRPKLTWTEDMVKILFECRDKAKEMCNSDNPPKNESGRRVGYMQLMYGLFLDHFPHLNYLTAQNLRDKVSSAERVHKSQNSQSSLTETYNLEVNANLINLEQSCNSIGNHGDINYIYTPMTPKECEAFELSTDILSTIYPNNGEMVNRLWRTRINFVPKTNDILSINKIVYLLQINYKIESLIEAGDYFVALWTVDCLTYAAVIGWYRVNNIKCANIRVTNQSNVERVVNWLDKLNKEIVETRRLLSKCVAEVERVKVNGRLTRKTKRNRKLIESMIGNISVYSLTKLIMRLKAKVHRLSISRKRKLKNQERRQYNTTFARCQGKIFSEFKDIINDQKNVEHPTFKKITRVRKYFENAEEVLRFWKSLWEKEDPGNPNVTWLNEYELLFQEIIPVLVTDNIQITKDDIWNGIRKKRNWSAPGPDMLVNYWLKKLFVIHENVRLLFEGVINSSADIKIWFTRGRTGLLEKEGDFVFDNTRPITCTNNIYKWFSSILLGLYKTHTSKYSVMQMDQRGAKSQCSGTFQNILIDDMVLKDAHDNKRNLACGWVDVRKAFDSLSHKWIEKMLEIHRFPTKLVSIIVKIMSAWNIQLVIPLAENDITSESIFIKNGVLQGDVICPDLYTLAKNPISWELRRFEGYKLSKPLNNKKITHLLFIDDLRVFCKSRIELRNTMSHTKQIMLDAGLEWNMKKTKVLNLKRGVVDISDGDLILADGAKIQNLASGSVYKFLGILENEMHDVDKLLENIKTTIVKRASVVWSSPLSDFNKIQATNVFVLSCIEYYLWTEKVNLGDLREIDMSIRNIMNINNAKYKLQANSSLYLPRSLGGRGLKQIEYIYKITRIKAAARILTDVDPEMKTVKEFDLLRMKKNRSSIIHDAIAYSCEDFNAEFVQSENGFELHYGDEQNRKSTSDISTLSKLLKKSLVENIKDEMYKSTWQGVTLKDRSVDNEVIFNGCFDWCVKWKDCPVEIINDIQSMYLQITPTLSFQKYRGIKNVNSTDCRLCHNGIENVQHLLSWCGYFLKYYFIRRHNKALQYIYFNILVKYNILEKCPPWYSDIIVKPQYENEDICILWDIPEFLGYEDEDESKSLRPDGKLFLKKQKIIYILEMSVPWITNRSAKFEEKEAKYIDIILALRILHPEHTIQQITFIMDGLGGYSSSLPDALKKIGFSRNVRLRILRNMQKIVLMESRCIINRFKQLTCK